MARKEPAIAQPDPDPLAELVSAAQRGDEGAKRELLRALQPRIRNLARYFVRGDEDVDDFSQEAMVAVIRGLHTYEGRGTVKSWADRVTARRVFALIRKRKHERELPRVYLRRVPQTEGRDPFLERRDLVRALDSIPTDQRNALVLHHMVGMAVPEVAAELEVPIETVRSRLRHGMRKLREKIGPDAEKVQP